MFRRYGKAYRQHRHVPLAQRRVMTAIAQCRTAVLGGHAERCDRCGHKRIHYNSCANRHCPKCQSLARARWIADRQSELLGCGYFHVVFTVPESIAVIALENKKAVYGILFRAASQTLLTIAADPKHLGARIGFFAVLHTWGQNLLHHPHLHCVVPGGGISPDGQRWVACRPGFLLPVRVLSRLFRRLFLTSLQQAFDSGKLRFPDSLKDLEDPAQFARHLQPAKQSEWCVYAKAPFAGPAQVLDYVGRYTHRVAISNNRLIDIDKDQVRFHWKDYRDGGQKTMALAADEFIRRFLIHVLPSGFQRIRYYGFLGNRHRSQKLALCRQLLHMPAPAARLQTGDYRQDVRQLTGIDLTRCPACHEGSMVSIPFFAALTGFQDSS